MNDDEDVNPRELFESLTHQLADNGVHVGFWAGRPPSPYGRILVQAKHDATADNHHEMLSLEKLRPIPNLLEPVCAQLRAANQSVDEGLLVEAAALYREALDLAPWPDIQLQCGALILMRSGVEPTPLTEEDFLYAHVAGELLFFRLHEDLIDSSAHGRKAPFLKVALEAFARPYAHYLRLALGLGSAGEELDDVDAWRMYLALDGLRSTLTELGDFDLLDRICRFYLTWRETFGYELRTDSGFSNDPFGWRFGYSEGYLRGKEAAGALNVASEITSASDRQIDVGQLAKQLARELKEIPEDVLYDRVAVLQEELGSRWHQLPRSARELLIQAEYLRTMSHPPDFDWSPIALQYCKALEVALREIVGAALEEFIKRKGRLGRMFADEYFSRRSPRLFILEEFERLMNRTRDNHLMLEFAKTFGENGERFLQKLPDYLSRIVRTYRNPSAHGDAPMAGASVAELRRLLLTGTDNAPPLVGGLARP